MLNFSNKSYIYVNLVFIIILLAVQNYLLLTNRNKKIYKKKIITIKYSILC